MVVMICMVAGGINEASILIVGQDQGMRIFAWHRFPLDARGLTEWEKTK